MVLKKPKGKRKQDLGSKIGSMSRSFILTATFMSKLLVASCQTLFKCQNNDATCTTTAEEFIQTSQECRSPNQDKFKYFELQT